MIVKLNESLEYDKEGIMRAICDSIADQFSNVKNFKGEPMKVRINQKYQDYFSPEVLSSAKVEEFYDSRIVRVYNGNWYQYNNGTRNRKEIRTAWDNVALDDVRFYNLEDENAVMVKVWLWVDLGGTKSDAKKYADPTYKEQSKISYYFDPEKVRKSIEEYSGKSVSLEKAERSSDLFIFILK